MLHRIVPWPARMARMAGVVAVAALVAAGCDRPTAARPETVSGTWVAAAATPLAPRWTVSLAEQPDGSFDGFAVEVRRAEDAVVYDVRGTHECPEVSVLITDSLGTRYRFEGHHLPPDSLVLATPWGAVRLGKLGPGATPSTF